MNECWFNIYLDGSPAYVFYHLTRASAIRNISVRMKLKYRIHVKLKQKLTREEILAF
jgi:hypothetical protein